MPFIITCFICTLYKVCLDQNIRDYKKIWFSLPRITEWQICKNTEIIWSRFKIFDNRNVRPEGFWQPGLVTSGFSISLILSSSLTPQEELDIWEGVMISYSYKICDMLRGWGLKGHPLGQNLAEDRKEQRTPPEAASSIMWPMALTTLNPVEKLAPVCYKE